MILLTGAAGVVGTAVRARADEQILALRHRRPVATARDVVGDVTRPRLGLTRTAYRRVCAEVRTVVHAAAVVSMRARPDEYASVNVAGTANVAALAEDAAVPLVHVSTAFVAGADAGADPGASERASSTYAASKRRAEEIVRGARTRTTILRPSIVAGCSRTGAIAAEQGLHQVLRALVDGPVRVIPGGDATVLDFVPQDYVADTILAVAAARAPPDELWLTCGDRALDVSAAARLLNAFIAEHELSGAPARVISDDVLQRLFVPVFLPELPARHRARMKLLLLLAHHLRLDRRLPTSAAQVERLYGIALPDPAAVLETNLRAWWARRDGRPEEAPR